MFFIRRHIEHLLQEYEGRVPLHHFLKNYFKANKKLGSRDRRSITEAVYLYFRMRPFLPSDWNLWQVIAYGLTLDPAAPLFLKQVMATISYPKTGEGWSAEAFEGLFDLSEGIAAKAWLEAFKGQPALFIRIPKEESLVLTCLRQHQIPFERIASFPDLQVGEAYRLPNGSRINHLLPEHSYVVQDLSTQRAGWAMAHYRMAVSKTAQVWDACAGAGGKSLNWKQCFPEDKLLATDVRPAILANLRKRFQTQKIEPIETRTLDLLMPMPKIQKVMAGRCFDYIICDVPCTGSGTWGRTPEQFFFFKKEQLPSFSRRQEEILSVALSFLKPGGYLFYMTCSVFKEENELVVKKVAQKRKKEVALIHQELFNGIAQHSDHLFFAVFRKK